MFGNHFVLLHFSHDDDDAPDSVEGINKLRSLCSALSWRRLIACATGDKDLQAIASRLPSVVLSALGRSIMGVLAWHAVALLVRLL
jgi:hypothetical protein